MQFFRELVLPRNQRVNPIRINSAYRIEDYDKKLQEVNRVRNQIKLQAAKEVQTLKAAFLARQATPNGAENDNTSKSAKSGEVSNFKFKDSDFSQEYTALVKELQNKNQEVINA